MILLSTNPIFRAYQGSDLFGKAIFLGLFILSIITWTILLQKLILYRDVKRRGIEMLRLFQKKHLNALALDFGSSLHPFASLYRNLKKHTLEILQKNQSVLKENHRITLSKNDMNLIEANLVSALSSETKKLESNLFILSTIVSLAPFIGLLGTVWGILLTFNELQSGALANANATIMGGLAMALGTTVIGLLVAIPALIGYNYLKASISHFLTDMEDFSQFLLASVELQYRQVEIYSNHSEELIR